MSIQTMLVSLSQAFLTTLAIFFLTLLGSLPLGLVVYFARKSRFSPLRWLTKVYIAIMRGCNNYCSYCVVPYTRGVERSRDPQTILSEALCLFENGYREVTL